MVRVALPADAGGIARVHIASWQVAYQGIFSRDFLGSLDIEVRTGWWEALLLRGERVAFVADAEVGVAGFCLVGPSDDAGWGEILAIYVDPAHWRQGMGAALLTAGEIKLAGDGFERALLWVVERNERARAFYERQGWVKGRPIRLETIGGTEVTEVRYERDLTLP
ncbi:MAG TPA: GNAT family N-acetyltransferase [Acidimicrobiia bacterium]|nr:GNAT family N-acetyltransferase [Acidimicrobiia bacterium]